MAVIAVLMYFVTAGSAWALAQVLRNKEIGLSFGALAITATFVVCCLVLGATDKCRSCGAFFLAIGAILSFILNVTGAGFLIYDIIQTPRDLDNYTVIVGVGAASAFLALLTGLSCCCCFTWCACVKGRDENGECICCSSLPEPEAVFHACLNYTAECCYEGFCEGINNNYCRDYN